MAYGAIPGFTLGGGRGDGKVVFSVEADNSNLGKGLDESVKIIKNKSKDMDNAGKGATSQLQDGMKKAKQLAQELGEEFGKLVVRFITESIEIATAIDKLDDTLESVFGSEGQKKIDEFAKHANAQFGLSELQVKKYAAHFGVLAKGMGIPMEDLPGMAQSVAGMAADLAASIPGATAEEAFEAIRSAFTGSGTTLKKKFAGIDLSATAMKAYAEKNDLGDFSDMSAAEQMMARYNYLYAQMSERGFFNAFARSKGSTENNQARIAAGVENIKGSVGFGEQLRQETDSLMGALADILDWVTGAPPVLTGDKESLTKALEEYKHYRELLMSALDKDADAVAERFGLTREMYEDQMYPGSFGEWVNESLLYNVPFYSGDKKQEAYKQINTYTGTSSALQEIDRSMKDIQTQLDYLNSLDGKAAEEAGAAVAQGLVDGLESKRKALEAETARILEEMRKIESTGSAYILPGHATGLDYVPRDNYVARLHAGESVLTAEEAKVWRAFKYTGLLNSGLNYDALGATMRENIHAGGNVYLDGQTVGRVISARQADSYRALERSGFQQ